MEYFNTELHYIPKTMSTRSGFTDDDNGRKVPDDCEGSVTKYYILNLDSALGSELGEGQYPTKLKPVAAKSCRTTFVLLLLVSERSANPGTNFRVF